jgi:hypothetical protein
MKLGLKYRFVLLLMPAMLLFSSCRLGYFNKLKLAAREESPEMFVQNTKKEIIPVADFRKHKFSTDTLLSWQTKSAYTRQSEGKSYERIIKGAMNMYTYTTYNTYSSYSSTANFGRGGMDVDSRPSTLPYFDLGLETPLIYFSRKNLSEPMEPCKPCMDILHQYDKGEKRLKTWKLINFAALGGSLAIAFASGDDISDFAVWSFTGLFFGGLASEGYRISRKGKNYMRLYDSVHAYNQYRL